MLIRFKKFLIEKKVPSRKEAEDALKELKKKKNPTDEEKELIKEFEKVLKDAPEKDTDTEKVPEDSPQEDEPAESPQPEDDVSIKPADEEDQSEDVEPTAADAEIEDLSIMSYADKINAVVDMLKEFGIGGFDYSIKDSDKNVITFDSKLPNIIKSNMKKLSKDLKIGVDFKEEKIGKNKNDFITKIYISNKMDYKKFKDVLIQKKKKDQEKEEMMSGGASAPPM